MNLRSLLPWAKPEAKAAKSRNYAGAQLTRWVDFHTSLEVAHKERIRDLAKLRAHSRDLSKNNVYAHRYVSMVSTHVVGPEGVKLESAITGNMDRPKDAWNEEIERAWQSWGSACSVDGQHWIDLQHLIAETVARDGEALVRLVRGFPNGCGFALEIIDPDRLDHEMNGTAGGNRVVAGVEMDRWGRPVAYHVWSEHPSDYETANQKQTRQRIPADQILHIYRDDRTRGTRGVPWLASAMVQLNMLGRLWTAELAAANAESDRLGILKTAQGVALDDIDADPVATASEMDSEHAHFMGLDPGLDVVFPTIQHPNGVLPQFSMALLKGIAAGLGVSYHSLSGDVGDANYSSARVALLEERDEWRKLQGWFVRRVCEPIFRAWLEMAVLSGQIRIPVDSWERLFAPSWWPRTWEWVDPQKDETASWNAICHGLSTHQEELGRQGKDWRETFRQIAQAKAYAEELGLEFTTKTPKKEEVPDVE